MRRKSQARIIEYYETYKNSNSSRYESELNKSLNLLDPYPQIWLTEPHRFEKLSHQTFGNERCLVDVYSKLVCEYFLKEEAQTLKLKSNYDNLREKVDDFLKIIYHLSTLVELFEKPLILLRLKSYFLTRFNALFTSIMFHTLKLYLPFNDLLFDVFTVYPDLKAEGGDEDESELYCSLKMLKLMITRNQFDAAKIQTQIIDANAYIVGNFAGKWNISTPKNLSELCQNGLIDLRISELFDMVMAYPASTKALKDLGNRMCRPSQRAAAVSSFQKSCSQNLLHGAIDTVDIVAGYIATIRSFAILDPRGVLLDKVSRPIRRYLRDREDTIPVLISGILGDKSSKIGELADMLSKARSESNEDDIDELLDLNWYPDPIDAPPDFIKEKLSDIVGSMLSIYENKEVFVREVMAVFADRLLSGTTSIESIQLNLDLLKSRFDDRELQSLDVMVRDIHQSNAINGQIKSISLNGARKLNANIVSRLFWPSFKKESLKLPPPVSKQLEAYAIQYSNIKHGRVLEWVENLGTVSIVLELEDRTLEFNVTPGQATVIHLFQQGPKTLEQIQMATNLNEITVRSILSFWVNKGVLGSSEDGSYRVLETADAINPDIEITDALVSSVQTAEERTAEEMQVYWQYIVGMLTNLGAKPVEQIHSFLKMLVPKETPYTKSQQELEQYLTILVDDQKLEFSQGNYKLPQ